MLKSEMRMVLLRYADYCGKTLKDAELEFFWQDVGQFSQEELKSAFESWRNGERGVFFPKSREIFAEIEKTRKRFTKKRNCMVGICEKEAFANLGMTWEPKRDFYICSECFYAEKSRQEAA